MSMRVSAAVLVLCAGAACAVGQVVINEVVENPPPAFNDEAYEYIEIYGRPGMSLNGYAVALLKGGRDANNDNVPELPAEIDEAFSLDGLVIGPNGLLVLYNDTTGFSFVPGEADADTTLATFTAQHIPTSDTPGKLGNDDSSTYVLVRKRPTDNFGGFTTSWRKDINQDADFNSKVDFGPPFQVGRVLEPYQMVDDIAWSNGGGKEYTRSSQDEFTETPGFNPDSVTRLAFFLVSPGPSARRADEEWLRGELLDDVTYDPTQRQGPDGADLTGTGLTPGRFNDTGSLTQFRFVTGDVNFDAKCTWKDVCAATALLGAGSDDTESRTNDNGTPTNTADDFVYTAWKHEGRGFNAVEVARWMDNNDGSGGANAPTVTSDDVAAIAALACEVDYNGDTYFDAFDYDDFVSDYFNYVNTGTGFPDWNCDGYVDAFDYDDFVSAFFTSSGC